MRALFPRHSTVSRLVVAALLAALGGCGGTGVPADRDGFEPVTCSASPSPCA